MAWADEAVVVMKIKRHEWIQEILDILECGRQNV